MRSKAFMSTTYKKNPIFIITPEDNSDNEQ